MILKIWARDDLRCLEKSSNGNPGGNLDDKNAERKRQWSSLPRGVRRGRRALL